MEIDAIRRQYRTLLAAYSAAFPNVAPPHLDWWVIWLQKYDPDAIHEAITTLSQHPLKDRFTRESTGKAISAMLRDGAVRRALLGVAK